MRFSRVGVLLAVSASAWLATGGSAAAATCDPITQRGNQLQQEFQAFTVQAYSDGVITDEEYAQSDLYTKAIAQVTADLASCIQTGVLPPGYVPVAPPPDTTPPVTNTFQVKIAQWRIGSHELRIWWDTAEPTTVKIRFVDLTKGVTASAASCHKLKKGHKRKKGQKSCQLQTDVGSLTAPPGTTSLKFNGKVGGHKLKPGSYRLIMTATDAAGNVSKPKTARLTILPAKR